MKSKFHFIWSVYNCIEKNHVWYQIICDFFISNKFLSVAKCFKILHNDSEWTIFFKVVLKPTESIQYGPMPVRMVDITESSEHFNYKFTTQRHGWIYRETDAKKSVFFSQKCFDSILLLVYTYCVVYNGLQDLEHFKFSFYRVFLSFVKRFYFTAFRLRKISSKLVIPPFSI